MTHHGAIQLHQTCLDFLRRLALENEGMVPPLGGGYTSEKVYDQTATEAWQATTQLLGLHDFRAAEATIGGHLDAIHAHEDRLVFDTEADDIALDDAVERGAA